jgi:hypothetical protein
MVAAGVTTGHEVRESRNKGEGAQVITMSGGEGCVMRETETVLSVIREPITRKVITGEPVMGKLIRRVREGADGKGPESRAPRRRPTSLGGRPHGKGSAPQTPRRAAHPSIKVAGTVRSTVYS